VEAPAETLESIPNRKHRDHGQGDQYQQAHILRPRHSLFADGDLHHQDGVADRPLGTAPPSDRIANYGGQASANAHS